MTFKSKKSQLTIILAVFFCSFQLFSQNDEDVLMVQKIHDEALRSNVAYDWLKDLTVKFPGRIAGSQAYRDAATHMLEVLNTIPSVTSRFQSCEADYWKRGNDDNVYMTDTNEKLLKLDATALGNSGSTANEGIFAEVVEVQELDEVDELGFEGISGKIVFFNRPMDPTKPRTFSAYGGAVDQRVYGPARAAKYGAAGALVRSMTLSIDDVPHTGVTVFPDTLTPIPALGVSTKSCELLSRAIKERTVSIFLQCSSEQLGKKSAPTVIGEIKGSEKSDDIILVGGHLDSWDISPGAHDDGAGCVQAMDVLRILMKLNYKPKRTIRCVLFSNEENGLAGGKTYAKAAKEQSEFHLAAIEADSGGFSPQGFSFDAEADVFSNYYTSVSKWSSVLEPYGLYFTKGGTGADISPLKDQKGLLVGLRTDSQRYFDFHHTSIDNIHAVHPRELALGAAAMASLVYLIDKYGLE
ncbi:MAG: M20/M25/M40 family metallo-hydrolase [Saprospiraceae bacterium]